MIVIDTSGWVEVLNENDIQGAAQCITLLRDGAPHWRSPM